MEVLIHKDAKVFDLLKQIGTNVEDKFLCLPYWFEVRDDEFLIMHRFGEALPKELKDIISIQKEDITEHLK